MRRDYQERQESCGLAVGDTVRILRKPDDFEDGWGCVACGEGQDCVGYVGKITEFSRMYGWLVNGSGRCSDCWWPYFVLEKVNPSTGKPVQTPAIASMPDKTAIVMSGNAVLIGAFTASELADLAVATRNS